MLVADSMANFIEENTGWDLPELNITSLDYSPVTKYYDNDIAHSMNLFSKLEPENHMIYPLFEWIEAKRSDKKLLIIGDSFTWDLLENLRLGSDCFAEVQFWFYKPNRTYGESPCKQWSTASYQTFRPTSGHSGV